MFPVRNYNVEKDANRNLYTTQNELRILECGPIVHEFTKYHE